MAHSVLNFSQNLTTTFALCHKIKFYACKFEKNLNKNMVILSLILPHFVVLFTTKYRQICNNYL